MASAGEQPLAPGDELDGRYRIVGELGSGSMGLVYVAEHLTLGRKVAIKTLRPERMADTDLVARFELEARAASAIGHPTIVHVFDLGRTPGGALYMAMELLEGRSLAKVLEQDGALAPARAIDIVVTVLEGLGEAHRCGIIHRDLKPENIFVVERAGSPDQIKLLDFGIAKAMPKLPADLSRGKGTAVGVIMGTPAYMSPEQANGDVDRIDPRTDLYAAGVVMYELLSGWTPFRGESSYAVLAAVLAGSYRPLRIACPRLPAALAAAVDRAMARDPDARFATAAEMRQALIAARVGAPSKELSIELPEVELDAVSLPPPSPSSSAATEILLPPPGPASTPAWEMPDQISLEAVPFESLEPRPPSSVEPLEMATRPRARPVTSSAFAPPPATPPPIPRKLDLAVVPPSVGSASRGASRTLAVDATAPKRKPIGLPIKLLLVAALALAVWAFVGPVGRARALELVDRGFAMMRGWFD